MWAAPLVQSALVQQPLVGTHRLVPGQFLKFALQAIRQVPVVASQAAPPLAVGVGQEMQVGPQKLVLVSDWQIPLQLCVAGAVQTPLQALPLGMQAPAHSLAPGQAGTQASPSQLTVPPPVGAWHGEHEVESFGPQVATALLSTHLPPHTWKPVLHFTAQLPLTQVAVPLASGGQVMQLAPQPVGSSSAAQRVLAPVPQTWVPAPQVKPQVVPLQVVALAPVGFGQGRQESPQVSTLVFMAQIPLQSWVPAPHPIPHELLPSTQTPAHSLRPSGQVGLQAVPSQVTEPPVGFWHAVHEVVPQLPTSLLLTHLPPHRWYPVLHASAQFPPTHCAVPFTSVGQAVHAIPHAVASLSSAQPAPHL